MSVPASRKSRSSVRRRRSHMHLHATNVGACEKCKEPVRPHHACGACGFYKGREAVKMKTPATPAASSNVEPAQASEIKTSEA